MKQMYLRLKTTLLPFLLMMFFSIQEVLGQTCPDGSPQGGTAYDTTIAFASGVTSTDVKFPQFDPQTGMVTCVRLCITITGVIDTLAMQNFAGSAQTGTFNYVRKDTLRGPGLISPLTNNANQSYGPYPLSPYDGIPGAGSDFYSQGDDTILNAQLCRTLNDSATIAQFYGTDSMTYNYTIDVSTGAFITGGSSSNLVLTSALVNFHFEYCTCPPVLLPLSIRDFNVKKLTSNKAELQWFALDDAYANYYYEAELSRNGNNFISIGTYDKKSSNEAYRAIYTAPAGENGIYYFRVRQIYSNGYVRYSNIKQVRLENSASVKFSLYPNPSEGIVGIKFDNISTGHFNIQIYNAQGQIIVQKGIVIGSSSYVAIGKLRTGTYWLRLTDKQSLETCVNQLIIK
jgi:hypothetical protein